MSTPEDVGPLAIDGGRPVRIESLPIGPHGIALLAAAARHMDPASILNPHVLLDPQDRLEA